MLKFWQTGSNSPFLASSLALILAVFPCGWSSSYLGIDLAIAQNSSLSNRNNNDNFRNDNFRNDNFRKRDIEFLKRSGQRWIEIRLRSQRLFAWQGNRIIYAVIVSTGKNATPTPTGLFAIQAKYPKANMVGENYNVPDVPNVMYYSGNYAIHGAYWHNNFGVPISHGCTNVAPDHAAWLYSWASVGTNVVVRN